MKTTTKRIVRAGFVAAALMTLPPMAAFAGEWRLNASACPDLREDRQDYRRDYGRNDRYEDRRDTRVIKCPARAWHYVRYRGDRYTPPRPSEIIIAGNGRAYYRDNHGARVNLDLGLDLGLGLRLGG